MDRYAVGQRFKLQASEPTLITNKLGCMKFCVEIVDQLCVDDRRRSQLLLVRIGASTFVAKCYDPHFSPPVSAREWPGGSQQFCTAGQIAETTAYKTLLELQGVDIPIFYGQYEYSNDDLPSQGGVVTVILLEFINDPDLSKIDHFNLSAEMKIALKTNAFALIEKIHSHGVYHRDIRQANFFWDSGDRLRLCDFEEAIFIKDIPKTNIAQWVSSDKGRLISMLAECGIEDERPLPPKSFFGILCT